MTAPSFSAPGDRKDAIRTVETAASAYASRGFPTIEYNGESIIGIPALLERAGLVHSMRDLEAVFRGLVGWTNEAPVPNLDASQRRDLLGATCRALIQLDDDAIMPSETFDLILDEAGADRIGGGTYAHGARAMLATPKFFDLLQQEPVR